MFLLPLVYAMALTDQQVVQTALNLHAQGLTEMDIAKQLLKSGATVEQLQRLNQQMGAMQQQNNGLTNLSQQAQTLRQNNGEMLSAGEQSPDGTQPMFNAQLLSLEAQKSRVFGQDIFRTPDAQFQPNMNQATISLTISPNSL